ncbi:transposase [Conchiformibius steedae]|uniref:transposase n=1 Tax=Conchiformibius steedae TaxID=153493 RepID=UPI002892EE97|nr:transposase [Conchiformibius steedae]
MIHVLADGSGRPLRIVLTAGQCSDLDRADRLLPYLKAGILIADKGYDAYGRVVKPLLDSSKQVVIPSLRNRKHRREYDRLLYCKRHLIENFFARLKQYRALATRYDKTAAAFRFWAVFVWLPPFLGLNDDTP